MPRRSGVEVATGLFVLAVAAGFLAYAVVNTGVSVIPGIHLRAEFDNVGALAAGADVRIAGVPVGRVLSTGFDPQNYQAVVQFTVRPDVKLSDDSAAVISQGGLLGSPFLSLTPGGSATVLKDGGTMTVTQSAANLEDLLGKFIFNVGALADATQKSLKEKGNDRP